MPSGDSTGSLTVAEATRIQHDLAQHVHIPPDDDVPPDDSAPLLVAGMDISYPLDPAADTAASLVLVRLTRPCSPSSSSSAPTRSTSITHLHTLTRRFPPPAFPYVPGLLAFREVGPLRALLDDLRTQHALTPDVLLCDGQGIAHPARCGLAAHLGVLTGIPSIGSAKSWYLGHEAGSAPDDADAPQRRRRPSFATRLPPQRGAFLPLYLDPSSPPVAHVLRSQHGINPIFVSPGHRISLARASALVLDLCSQYRIPDPIRWADHASRQALRQWAPEDEGKLPSSSS